MLVLSRKPAEAIRIGDDILIKVIAIRGGQVKLGIEAPQGIRVMRTEPRNGEKLPPVPGADGPQPAGTEQKIEDR